MNINQIFGIILLVFMAGTLLVGFFAGLMYLYFGDNNNKKEATMNKEYIDWEN